jgi:hypothetical protein
MEGHLPLCSRKQHLPIRTNPVADVFMMLLFVKLKPGRAGIRLFVYVTNRTISIPMPIFDMGTCELRQTLFIKTIVYILYVFLIQII